MPVSVLASFRCGHPRTPENTKSNGKSVRCNECHRAGEARRKARDPELFRLKRRDRNRKFKGYVGRGYGSHNRDKANCPANHPYDEENTYLYQGSRRCKTCRRATATAYYHAKRGNGGSHTQAEWIALCEQYGSRCLACDRAVPLTRDHVVPVSKGGTSDIANLQPLCLPCNAAKKDHIKDYRPVLAAN